MSRTKRKKQKKKQKTSFDIASRLTKAVQYHQSGQFQQAEKIYKKILDINPKHSDSLHLLGLIAHQVGNNDIAINLISEAIQNDPGNPTYCYNLGTVCQDQGKPGEAIACYQKALHLKPDYADAYYSLGAAFQDQGKSDEAIACYQKALHLKPDYADAYNNMGNAFKGQGKPGEAIACYQKALHLKPDCADVYYNMGNALQDQGKPGEAIACYQKALYLKPDCADAYNNMGHVFKDQGKPGEAIACYQKVLHLEPYSADVYCNMGNALKNQGNIDEAETCYRKALSIKPHSVNAYHNLAGLIKFRKEDDAFSVLESVKKKKSLSDHENAMLHFTLGKIYEDIDDCESAFENYRLGNELRKKCRDQDYRILDHEKLILLFMETFDADFFDRRRDFGIATELPVFIVGMPRSGTTLVEQILSSHPQVFGAGELPDINQIKEYLIKQDRRDSFAKVVESMDARLSMSLAEQYLTRLRSLSDNVIRITDKMTSNFKLSWLIVLLFPKAKIINCQRNPLDTCLSCYFTNFTQDLGYKYDLRNLGLYYRQYQRLMKHWHTVLPIPILDVQYEELVENQEYVSRKIIEFCNLDWDDNCLEFYNNRRCVQTASASQVRRKIYKTSIGRWKKYEEYLAPLLDELRHEL